MTHSIDYMKNKEALEYIQSTGHVYRKKEKTLLRLPKQNELDTVFITYVKSGSGVRQESITTITKDKVIARNPTIIGHKDGKDIYNEWLVDKDVIAKNYGKETLGELTEDFKPFQKTATITAALLTIELLAIIFPLTSGNELPIKVDWSPHPMVAHIGDYLTDAGYSIAPEVIENTYEIVK